MPRFRRRKVSRGLLKKSISRIPREWSTLIEFAEQTRVYRIRRLYPRLLGQLYINPDEMLKHRSHDRQMKSRGNLLRERRRTRSRKNEDSVFTGRVLTFAFARLYFVPSRDTSRCIEHMYNIYVYVCYRRDIREWRTSLKSFCMLDARHAIPDIFSRF